MSDGFWNDIRNLILAAIGAIFLICLTVYVSSVAFYISERGVLGLDLGIITSTKVLDFIIYYYGYWFANLWSIDWKFYNYFMLRLLGSTFIPILLAIIFVLRFKNEIYEARPFKKEESLHGEAR